ncbi:hypothetical protein FACS1894191_4180 [Clostridia bacterium]|nr:hypothetical protein FACS1894191_4180 [Clostridia bacterium]
MALYHCSIKIVSRGKGKSAVAAAAYRSGDIIKNEYDGVTHDYTAKRGIVHTEILLPQNAPSEYQDRAILWNAVEKIEKAKNSQLAREIEIALPRELTREQNISLAREYVQKHFVSAGMCADICIHDTGKGNPHAHIMLTMRPLNEDKSWGGKQKKEYILDAQGDKIYDKKKRQYKCKSIPSTDWNDQTKAEEWRAAWADMCNLFLEQNGHAERVNHRSYERQGIDKIPTIHLGVAASQMERKGIATERGNINREIAIANSQLRQTKARINHLKDWLKEESANTAPPTLTDIISEILNSETGASRYAKIRDLKSAAAVLNFLTANHITGMAGLNSKVNAMGNQFEGVREKLKKVERRIKTLDEHLRHSGNYKSYRPHKAQYEKLNAEYKTAEKSTGLFAKSKAQKALDTANEYREIHRAEIGMYDNAEKYLKDVLQARFDPKKLPPIAQWKAEREKLMAEKGGLYQNYYRLRDEVKNAEAIRRTVEQLTRADEPERQQRKRSRDMEL